MSEQKTVTIKDVYNAVGDVAFFEGCKSTAAGIALGGSASALVCGLFTGAVAGPLLALPAVGIMMYAGAAAFNRSARKVSDKVLAEFEAQNPQLKVTLGRAP